MLKTKALKRILLVLMAALMCVQLCGCAVFSDRNWQKLEESAVGTEIVIAVVGQKPEFVKWLKKPFKEFLLEQKQITLTVKETSLDQLIQRLETEKLARDRGENAPGAYDIILFSGDGYAELKHKGLIYGPFSDRLQNTPLIDKNAVSFQYREQEPNNGYYLPIGRRMLTMYYSNNVFYDSPENYQEFFDTISKLKGKATYPDPLTTWEGQAFLLGYVSSQIDMEPYIKPGRDLEALEAQLREAMIPLMNIRIGIMDAGLSYPKNIEQLFTDGKSFVTMHMDYMQVGDKVKSYEYPETTTAFVINPVGTYTTIGVIPFNSENKSGAMVALSTLLEPEAQAGMVGTGLMTIYHPGIPVEKAETLKMLKLHRSILKFSSYIDAVAPDFDQELIDLVLKVWKEMLMTRREEPQTTPSYEIPMEPSTNSGSAPGEEDVTPEATEESTEPTADSSSDTPTDEGDSDSDS